MTMADDNRKILDQIKRVTEQGSPFDEEAPKKDDIVISKEDFDALLVMAKRADKAEMDKEQEKHQETPAPQQLMQTTQAFEPEQEKSGRFSRLRSSMDYGNVLDRPVVLYFDTDRTCRMIRPKVNDNGSVEIGERTFDFSKGQPSILNMGVFGKKESHPFYIVKYSSMKPIDIALEYPDSNPTPEQASRLVELGTLETLSKIPAGKIKKGILILLMIVSMVMGFVVAYVLTMFGVI